MTPDRDAVTAARNLILNGHALDKEHRTAALQAIAEWLEGPTITDEMVEVLHHADSWLSLILHRYTTAPALSFEDKRELNAVIADLRMLVAALTKENTR
jgi:hypothetical protein